MSDAGPRIVSAVGLLLLTALVFGCPSSAEKPRGEPSPAVEQGTETAPPDQTAESPATDTADEEDALRTIVLVIDGLEPGDVRPGLTPALCRMAHCPGTTEPDAASHATLYAEARAAMLTQTNANHVAMMTGEYGARSGIVGNAFYNRITQRIHLRPFTLSETDAFLRARGVETGFDRGRRRMGLSVPAQVRSSPPVGRRLVRWLSARSGSPV